MRVLVAGGAGFIGSHMTKMLRGLGHEAVVYDNLSRGHRHAVLGAELVVGDLADWRRLDALLAARRFDAVMHFASLSHVGESVSDPGSYSRNNVGGTAVLLEAMMRHGVVRLVYSSSAAVFGEPAYLPIDERHPLRPANPYGHSKWVVENLLAHYGRVQGLGYACLRYFNAAGADPDGTLGESHGPETHLIPLALQAASGRRPCVNVFGADYDTPDGTCVRDYVHVTDLCRAHLLALDRLRDGGASAAFNLGSGNGFSVREVVEAVMRVTGRPVKTAEADRRPGDPARLVADAGLARLELAWSPRYPDLDAIIAHAWAWERKGRRRNARCAAAADAGHALGRRQEGARATISIPILAEMAIDSFPQPYFSPRPLGEGEGVRDLRFTGGSTMVKLEFHDPSGALEVTQPHAPRLASLEGKRIGFVSNEQWQAYRMLPMLKQMLEQDFPGVTVLPIDSFPQGNALIGTEETAALVKKSRVDAIIVGNAA